MVGDARFVNVKLRVRKLGGTEINIVLNTSVNFASPKYGLKYRLNVSTRVHKKVMLIERTYLGG